MRHVRAALLCLALGLTGDAAAAPAAPADSRISTLGFGQFKHTRWTIDDGVPGSISEMAQTPDGYLWLTARGLHRFDGVTFERIEPSAGSAMERAQANALVVSRAGELWVGFLSFGGVAVYRDGRLQDMRMPNPPRAITGIVQTTDGAIWANSPIFSDRIRRFAGGRWEKADTRFGLPPGTVMNMQATKSGGLWVSLIKADGHNGGLAYLAPGADRFRDVPVRLGFRPGIALDPGGNLWVSDTLGTRLLFDRDGKPPATPVLFPAVPNLSSSWLAFDPAGGLWGTTTSAGIFYTPSPLAQRPAADTRLLRFTAADGLTSNISLGLFVDREGSIWIGSDRGLDQFRRASAYQEPVIPTESLIGYLIAGSREGNVYVGSDGTLFLIAPHALPRAISRYRNGNLAMCSGWSGGAWMIDPTGVFRLRGDRAEKLASYPDKPEPADCAEDRQGRLWLTLMDDSLIWFDTSGWHVPTGALKTAKAWQIASDPAGDLAFTTPKDLGRFRGDRMSVTKLAPFDIGPPQMLVSRSRDLFIGGSNGLLRVRGDRIARLDGRRIPWISAIRDIVQTPQGETWIVATSGLSRVSTAEFDRAFDDPHAPLTRRLFDTRDGLASSAQQTGLTALQAALGGDGRVWFLNREGAAFIDPADLRPNRLLPPVAIRTATSGGISHRDPAGLVLPPGTRSIEIAYTALSLAVPQRVQFRYRLDGVDDDWVDPGARRLASYSNLGPGTYRFHVIATNNDGVWNRKGATLDFEIRPTFVESWPFRLLCGLVVAGLLWLAYSLRLRSVANRIRARMTERMNEREHIARELHDTLLQSVQTLTLRFQLAVDDLPQAAAGRPALEEAIDRADQVIAEGRDQLRNLRPFSEEGDVRDMIADIVAKRGFDPAVEVSIVTTGTPRALDPSVMDEVTRIAGEAVFNVWRHARPTRLTIVIGFQKAFGLSFLDNGVGIAPDIMATGGKDGHFGLPGMRERARKLGGELVVRANPGGGTEVLLTVPGRIAYKASGFRRFFRRWRMP